MRVFLGSLGNLIEYPTHHTIALANKSTYLISNFSLKFTSDASGRAFFISSDMFYLEVIVEQGGLVKEVHIQHEGKSEPQTCNEIAVCLNSGNFSRFTTHLQVNFKDIYA